MLELIVLIPLIAFLAAAALSRVIGESSTGRKAGVELRPGRTLEDLQLSAEEAGISIAELQSVLERERLPEGIEAEKRGKADWPPKIKSGTCNTPGKG